jgi:hypothetical protein
MANALRGEQTPATLRGEQAPANALRGEQAPAVAPEPVVQELVAKRSPLVGIGLVGIAVALGALALVLALRKSGGPAHSNGSRAGSSASSPPTSAAGEPREEAPTPSAPVAVELPDEPAPTPDPAPTNPAPTPKPAPTPRPATAPSRPRPTQPAPSSAPAIDSDGYVQVTSKPHAQIEIDGTPRGATPVRVKLPAGTHTVKFTVGPQTSTKQVTVTTGATTTVKEEFDVVIDPKSGDEPVLSDRDGDRIPDLKDRCPDQAETMNLKDDSDGCPD